MRLTTSLPFPNLTFKHWAGDDSEAAVLIVKGTFGINSDGGLGVIKDQPLITGRTYHATNRPPYQLPEHKTRMTIKSQTHKGKGFNELRFEDEAGKEEVFLHAQKDKNTKVENNQTERVNTNKVESIGHNKASEIGNNLTQVVDGNMELRVGPANTGTVSPSGANRDTQGIAQMAPRIGMPGSSAIGQGNVIISVEKIKRNRLVSHTMNLLQSANQRPWVKTMMFSPAVKFGLKQAKKFG